MKFGETITYLVSILVTVVIITEMVLFYFYYRKKAKEMNKRLPNLVTYIIISSLFCCIYDSLIFLLNYKLCFGLEDT